MVERLTFDVLGDERGKLISLEGGKNISFDINRVYYIYGTKRGVERGFHAHKNLKQVLVAVSGKCTIVVDDGFSRTEFVLDSPNSGLYIEGVVWREMKKFSDDSVLMVLASDLYDEADYIRDYEEFVNLAKARNNSEAK